MIIPSVVRSELIHREAPPQVREWISKPSEWLNVRPAPSDHFDVRDFSVGKLDDGEIAVINLAASIKADLLLMDDREGVRFARKRGFAVTGTLGVLELAGNCGLLDLGEALSRLQGTNFYCSQEILDELLARYRRDK